MSQDRTYYCALKFKFIKIDLQAGTIYVCDAAKPQHIDFDWLENNPGKLFNTDITVNDRKLMLQNVRNPGCEQNCWPAEDRGAISPRLIRGCTAITKTELYTYPEIVDLTINGECNLTCLYCCKEFSSSWRRDLVSNGPYNVSGTGERYKLSNKDYVLENLSQSNIKKSKNYFLLLNEIKLFAPKLKKIVVSGGEPLLDNQLIDILSDMDFNPDIEFILFCGLGLSMSRFEKLLDKLQTLTSRYKNFQLRISAESTEKIYEFNRYGNTWEEFKQKIQVLIDRKINFTFHSTLCNLNIIDFSKFYQLFSDVEFSFDIAYVPNMLAPHVLDDDTKEFLKEELKLLPEKIALPLVQSMITTPTEEERLNLKEFLVEFTTRRSDLNLNIFPSTLLKWLDLNVV